MAEGSEGSCSLLTTHAARILCILAVSSRRSFAKRGTYAHEGIPFELGATCDLESLFIVPAPALNSMCTLGNIPHPVTFTLP